MQGARDVACLQHSTHGLKRVRWRNDRTVEGLGEHGALDAMPAAEAITTTQEGFMNLRTLALTGAAFVAFAGPASAGTGWYLGVGGGWSQLEKISYRFPPAPAAGKIKFNNSARYDGSVGYKWDNGLRIEFEAAYASFHPKSYTPFGGATVPFGGHLQSSTFMLNAAYDLPLTDWLAFTMGGGAGVAHTSTNTHDAIEANVGDNTKFAWQGIAGFTWSAAPFLDVQADYRYISTSRTRNQYQTPIGTFASTQLYGPQHQQAVMLTLRFFLDSAAEPEAAPMPVIAPQPTPMPIQAPAPVKTFIVFFDFDKSNLTAEAQSVVTEAVAAAKTNGWVKLMVTGHTDTVGSDTYNQALSERRADAVKDEMVRQGMDGSGITTQGKSFHDPLVGTGPGVREPQNRRAVIEY